MARISADVTCPRCGNHPAVYEYPTQRNWHWVCLPGEGGCKAAGTIRKGSRTPHESISRTFTCDNCAQPYQSSSRQEPRLKTHTCPDCRSLLTHNGRNRTDIVIKRCEWCEVWFVKRKTKASQRFCALPCMKLHARQQTQQRRKAGGQPAFKITRDQRLAIAYAYAYKCHLCSKLIDVSRRAPHPLALTIDHLIPQSAGGTHDTTNLAPAHFKCNSDRAHTGPAQLQIIGAP